MRTLQDFTTAELITAIDTNFGAMLRLTTAGIPGTSWYEEPGIVRFVSGLAHPYGNVIWGGQFTPEDAESRIQEALAPIVERNVPGLWVVGATTQPNDLRERLTGAGLACVSEATGMAADISAFTYPHLPKGVAVREARSEEDMNVWTDVLSRGYEIPAPVCALFVHYAYQQGCSADVRYFIGSYQGVPVACSMLAFMDGIAGIYCVSTLPEARRKGVGAAVTALPLTVAAQAGYKLAVLQASALGHPIYRKLGFQDYGKVGFSLLSASAPR